MSGTQRAVGVLTCDDAIFKAPVSKRLSFFDPLASPQAKRGSGADWAGRKMGKCSPKARDAIRRARLKEIWGLEKDAWRLSSA